MRVIVINYMEPLPSKGSKEWRAHQIARNLQSLNVNVEYITSKFDHFKKEYRVKGERTDMPYNLKLIKASSYKTNKSLMRIISNIVFSFNLLLYVIPKKPGIVWIISYPHAYAIMAITIRRALNAKDKLIVDMRDSPCLPTKGIASIAFNIIESTLLSISSNYVDLWMGAGQYIYKYLGVNIQTKAKESFEYLPMSNVGFDGKPIESIKDDILFIGSLTDSFEIEKYLDIANKSSEGKRIHIVGDGPKWNELNREYKHKNIIFYGNKNINEIKEISKMCTYGILPYETSSGRFKWHKTNKFVEYISLGLIPIINRDLTEMAEFCSRNNIGFVFENYKELECWWNRKTTRKKEDHQRVAIAKLGDICFSEKVFKEKLIQGINRCLAKDNNKSLRT